MICAADVRCLDDSSKRCLKELCLGTCLYRHVHSKADSELLENLHFSDSALQIAKND